MKIVEKSWRDTASRLIKDWLEYLFIVLGIILLLAVGLAGVMIIMSVALLSVLIQGAFNAVVEIFRVIFAPFHLF